MCHGARWSYSADIHPTQALLPGLLCPSPTLSSDLHSAHTTLENARSHTVAGWILRMQVLTWSLGAHEGYWESIPAKGKGEEAELCSGRGQAVTLSWQSNGANTAGQLSSLGPKWPAFLSGLRQSGSPLEGLDMGRGSSPQLKPTPKELTARTLCWLYFLALGSKAFLGGVVLEACSLPLMATPDCQRVGGMWSRCLRRGRAKCGGIWQPDKISARSPNQLSKGACAWELPDKSRQYDLHLAAGLPHLLGP